MSVFQTPAIGSRNYATDPVLTIRLLSVLPPDLGNLQYAMTPNELVGIFNGIDNTIRLFVTSGDGRALLAVVSS